MKVAKEEGCDFVSHGCTGKGNDQVRFELAFLAIQPTIKIIAPWRIPAFFNRFQGRNDLLDYAAEKKIPVTSTKAKPFSMDANLSHCSYEAGILEDPSLPPPEDMWTLTEDPQKVADKPIDIAIRFEKGLPVKLISGDKSYTDSLELFVALNAIGKATGVGRIDIVEVGASLSLQMNKLTGALEPLHRAEESRLL
jgi:argininosuccinate synthase